MSRSINNITTTQSSSSSATNVGSNDIQIDDKLVINNDTTDSGLLINSNQIYNGIVIKNDDKEIYLVKNQSDENNLSFNSLNTLNCDTVKCNNIYSTQSTTINSINLQDNSIILNKNSVSDVADTGIYMQHASNLYTGLVRDQSKQFCFVNISSLPNNTMNTFTNSQLTDVKLRDINVNGNLNINNVNGNYNSISTSSSQIQNQTYILPLTAPANNGDVLCINNANGTMYWSNQVNTNQTNIGSLQTTVNGYASTFTTATLNSTNFVNSQKLTIGDLSNLDFNSQLIINKRQNQNNPLFMVSNSTAGQTDWNRIIFKSGLYSSNTLRSNAMWEFGIRQETDANQDRFYIGRNGVTSSEFVLLRNGYFGFNVQQPTHFFQVNSDDVVKLTSGTWGSSSDARVKDDIIDADIDICYDNIKNMKLKRFKWNEHYFPNINDRNALGWIAQDIQKFFPKCVLTRPQNFTIEKGELDTVETIEDFKTLDMDQIIKTMFGAIQKLMNKVETLENEITLLKQN